MTKIHPSAVVDKDAVLAEGVVVGPQCMIEAGAQIGAGTILEAGVIIGSQTILGQENHLHSHCVVGGMPQILGQGPGAQAGGLVIGDHNVIREHVTVNRSMVPGKDTKIGHHNLLMASSHVGHDCVLEDHIVLSNVCMLSGHCKLETGVWISGMSGVHQFVILGKWAYAAGMTAMTHDVPPFLIVSGNYPPRVRGVNRRGIQRAGLDEEAGTKINKAYQALYRKEGALSENARKLAERDDLDDNVRAILDSIKRSSLHRYGRYLETFR